MEKIYYILFSKTNVVIFCEKLDKTFNKAKIKSSAQELQFVIQIFNGIEYLHETMGLAHCDIKENNIMINNEETHVKLIDFNNCVHKTQFKSFELGVTLAKKHKESLPMTI